MVYYIKSPGQRSVVESYYDDIGQTQYGGTLFSKHFMHVGINEEQYSQWLEVQSGQKSVVTSFYVPIGQIHILLRVFNISTILFVKQ